MTEKTKVTVTASTNFEGIMILMDASFAEVINEDRHFFEDLGRELDTRLKGDDYNDNKQDKSLNTLREELEKEKATVNAYTLTIKELNKTIENLKKENEDLEQYKKWQEEFINDMDRLLCDKRRVTTRRFQDE